MTLPQPEIPSRRELMPRAARLIGMAASVVLIIIAIFIVRDRGDTGDIVVANGWVRATPPGAITAATYLTVHNATAEPDRLIGVASGIVPRVSLHATVMEGDVATMVAAPVIDVPAGGTVEFGPRGYHIMLEGLIVPLFEGDEIDLALTFEKAGRVRAWIEVVAADTTGPPPPTP